MFRIVEKQQLTPDTVLMRIAAPRVAKAARPGQFVMVRVDEKGERIPLTIADYSAEEGWVAIVTQTVGATSLKLNSLAAGDAIADFTGPLGRPSDFVTVAEDELRAKRFLFIAGGVGAAPVYPQVKWLHERGVRVDVIIGARNASLLIFTDQMRAACDNLYIATDDGSAGFHGMVTSLVKELVEVRGEKYDEAVTIGPMVMMKFTAMTTAELKIPTIASLNTLMVDGTGMCGACRVTVGGKTVFACVDGPEFDAHQVDFDEAMRRQTMYRTEEKQAYDRAKEGASASASVSAPASDHKCKIGRDE
ncbi:MAG: sulfide/dihydroorotate dehydrogenase-like FAD/NAD-binding protein [Alistipes sp.]|jgi:ferredoxin--NADP+ reductase|nr:sulfide/dihydroorotate dehydrogenase-like FAD/NAD-binding protein [Alistipes sp.]